MALGGGRSEAVSRSDEEAGHAGNVDFGHVDLGSIDDDNAGCDNVIGAGHLDFRHVDGAAGRDGG